jgi:membrane-bound lytic murein transglycosylase MltF
MACISLFILLSCLSARAHLFAEMDTSRKATLPPSLKKPEPTIILQKANVVYPPVLAGNEETTLGYIERFSISRRNYLINTYIRSKKYFPKATAILKKYEVPQEFRVLLALESGFNGNAVSRAGAVGYWQIMDETAREYGMKIAERMEIKGKHGKVKKGNKHITRIPSDDRKNFDKSTRVAARYLKDRVSNLNGDWLLIAASYNCGVGNVWKAIQKCGKASPSFWDIKDYLPDETNAYVMNFITLNVIYHNYEAFVQNKLCFRDVTCQVSEQPEVECKEDCDEGMVSTGCNDY